MKQCPSCEEYFDLKTGTGSGGRNRVYCYACLPFGLPKPERVRLNQTLNVNRVAKLKLTTGCQVCGYNKCANALEFHHMITEDKQHNPSDLAKTSWVRFMKERALCIILCANCHREQQAGLISKEQLQEIFELQREVA